MKDYSDLEDQLIGFELAKLLKQKGFEVAGRTTYRQALFEGKDENWEGQLLEGAVFEGFYDYHANYKVGLDRSNDAWEIYARPTQSLVQRWLREKYNIHVFVTNPAHSWKIWDWSKPEPTILNDTSRGRFSTYGQSLENALLFILNAIPDLIPEDLLKKYEKRSRTA